VLAPRSRADPSRHAVCIEESHMDTIERSAGELGAMLASIDARLSRIEGAVASATALVDQVPMAIATAADVFDDHAARLGDVEQRLSALGDVLERMTRPATLASLKQLIESGMLEPRALQALGRIASALIAVSDDEPARVGAFGALRAFRDADVQRALGFLLRVAKSFGGALADEAASDKRLPAHTREP
jgi:hypothetical protein